mmetsp:Transcript_327/g.340  ORF Transcript_327/g.340 Transcript_327/m.340 type:complete len:89 (+) Transcript_327:269-535(+)
MIQPRSMIRKMTALVCAQQVANVVAVSRNQARLDATIANIRQDLRVSLSPQSLVIYINSGHACRTPQQHPLRLPSTLTNEEQCCLQRF